MGRLAQALIVVLALGILGCGTTAVNSRQPSPPPARPCSLANPGVTPSPGGADVSCGFQLGSELTGIDCSGNPALPDGLTVEHADAHLNLSTARLRTGSGGCQLPDAGQDEEAIVRFPVAARDVVELVDFAPGGGPAQGWDMDGRCSSDANCVTNSIGAPGYSRGVFQNANGSRATHLNLAVKGAVHYGSANRAILALRGSTVVVCLNGDCWSEANAVDVNKPGPAAFRFTGHDSGRPASVTITRFLAFAA